MPCQAHIRNRRIRKAHIQAHIQEVDRIRIRKKGRKLGDGKRIEQPCTFMNQGYIEVCRIILYSAPSVTPSIGNLQQQKKA